MIEYLKRIIGDDTAWQKLQDRRAAVMEPVAAALHDGLGGWRDKTAALMRAGFVPWPYGWDLIASLINDDTLDVRATLEKAARTL